MPNDLLLFNKLNIFYVIKCIILKQKFTSKQIDELWVDNFTIVVLIKVLKEIVEFCLSQIKSNFFDNPLEFRMA